MSKFGKVLVVLLLLLSAVFAGAQSVLYAKRQNYAALWKGVKKERDELQKSLDDAKAEAKSAAEDLRQQITVLSNSLAAAKQKAESLAQDIERVRVDKSQLEVANKELRDSVDKTTKLTEDLTKQTATLEAARRDNEKTIRDQMTEIANLKKEGQDKSVQIASLEQNVANLEKVKTQLNDALKSAQARIARYVALGVALPEENVPPMDARILKVDNDLKVVVLSVGTSDGVKTSNDFTVYRGSQFVGIVRVNYVSSTTCVAQPVLVADGQQIQVGDSATTRIQ